MNLNNPSKDELILLLASCDDESSHHRLWVDFLGNVFINKTADFPVDIERRALFWYETWCQGNRYTGREAVRNLEWVNTLYGNLIRNFEEGDKGFIDY